MHVITTSISSIDFRFPHLSRFVGNGSCMVVSGKGLVMAQRSDNAVVRAYSCVPVPSEDWKESSGIDWREEKKGLKEFVERYHADWAEEVKQLFLQCDEGELAVRPVYMFPPKHKFERKLSGVTLLGDAAHALSPFAGTGVNNAMADAYDLSVALEKIAFEGAGREVDAEPFAESDSEKMDKPFAEYDSEKMDKPFAESNKTFEDYDKPFEDYDKTFEDYDKMDELFAEYEEKILERASNDAEECRYNQEMWLSGKPVSDIEAQFAEMVDEEGASSEAGDGR
ncbi:hypothetical protein NMY22_g18682 [Coprinellus aureogranulatus]|nr:hypothetical protein NMY22_g18682 [Coprinellus aureogranulatus]